jgi:hypothetical protein
MKWAKSNQPRRTPPRKRSTRTIYSYLHENHGLTELSCISDIATQFVSHLAKSRSRCVGSPDHAEKSRSRCARCLAISPSLPGYIFNPLKRSHLPESRKPRLDGTLIATVSMYGEKHAETDAYCWETGEAGLWGHSRAYSFAVADGRRPLSLRCPDKERTSGADPIKSS